MSASELIALIPGSVFQELAIETKVDHQVKSLSGEVVFKLIVFSMLNTEKVSLRVMDTFLHSARFKSFSGYDITVGRYNSIRDRICAIKAVYFEKLFERIFAIYNKELREENALCRADSTYIGLAAKLLECGMKNGSGGRKPSAQGARRFVKCSVDLKGSLPAAIKVFNEQSYASEDKALAELIEAEAHLKDGGGVVVFDRGLKCRAAFDKFSDQGRLFVARTSEQVRMRDFVPVSVPGLQVIDSSKAGLDIISDGTGLLITQKQKSTTHRYRVIKAVNRARPDTVLCFISNIGPEDASAQQIAAWYRQRWDIEVFFKFIKQHLNAAHLVSRDINGIKVMRYMTMIVATLILAYRKLNGIKSYKIAKLRFELDLDKSLTKEIVLLCGGDPNRAPHLFSSA